VVTQTRRSPSPNDISKAIAFFSGAEMPARVWSRKYRLRDKADNFLEESPLQTFCRMADAVNAPTDSSLRFNLVERRFIPAGRVLFALGNPYYHATCKNCYVLGLKDDSLEAISDLRKEMARTYAMGGGVGIDLSMLRPAGAPVKNCAITSSGAASFADGFSHLTGEIGQNGRRGALMISLSVDHPDIERFVHSKNDFDHKLASQIREKLPRKLYKKLNEEVIEPRRACGNANMSVRITDRFMKAVKDGKHHITRFIMDDGEEIERVFDAKKLFRQIVEGAWSHGCPGCLFWDTMAREDNRNYLASRWHIVTTNPCFPGHERLHTDQGMVTFKELYESQQEIVATVDNRALAGDLGVSTHPAVPVFLTAEEEDVFKIVTKEGFEVEATPYHKFYVEGRGRVELRDLEVGQNLLIQSGKGQFGTRGDEKTGALLGLVTGDGHFTNRGRGKEAVVVSLWQGDQALVEEVAEHVSEICREHSIKGPWKQTGIAVAERRETRVRSTVLARYLKDRYGFCRETKHRVPEVVWQGTEACVKGYLRALFQADGTVNATETNSCCTIRLASSYPELLKDVQKLLINFGIASRIHLRRKAGRKLMPDGKGGSKLYNYKTQYDLIIGSTNRDRFMEEIGFLLDEKTRVYEEWKNRHPNTVGEESFLVEVEQIEFVGRQTVYCTTQQNKNTIVVSGCVVGNCGEQPLSDGGSCNLGAINLARFTTHPYTERAAFDWDGFKRAIRDGVRFLDEINTIELDENRAPIPKQAEVTHGLRQIGLGVMGYGDLLLQHQIKYASDEAMLFTERLFRTLRDTAYHESIMLAKEKGPFPAFDWDKIKRSPFIDRLPAELKKLMAEHGLRNSNVLSIAPTGTIAIMGETTGGIEPEFAFQLTRAAQLGTGKRTKFTYLTPTAQRIAKALGKSVPQGEIEGAVDMSWLPEWAVASHQIDPKRRAKVQGLIQQFIDTAISSTVNLPEEATIEDVMDIYWTAYEAGCKGVTIYREGSREGILQTLQEEERLEYPIEPPLQIKSRRISFKGEHGLQRILINLGDYRPGVPCEVSVIHGKSGTEVASYASALGIIISIALQNGVPPNKIARAREGISAGWATRLPLDGKGQKPTSVQSVPDAVAAVLKKFYGNGIYEKGLAGQPINGEVNKIGWELTAEERNIARTCPKCGKQTYIPESGCWKCINPACDVGGICG
jgi:ribonucleoside-diphosphate reductase alpha chain